MERCFIQNQEQEIGMNLKTLFEACSAVCDKHIAKNEAACVRLGDELIPYTSSFKQR